MNSKNILPDSMITLAHGNGGRFMRELINALLYLTLNAFIEEGLELSLLDRVLASMAQACRDCNVPVVVGDTKVLRRGQGGGVYFATTGIGVRPPHLRLGLSQIRPDDAILLSGSVGDHGTAVLLAREQFGLSGDLTSDSASVLPITQALTELQDDPLPRIC